MRNNHHFILSGLSAFIIYFTSCEKFVDVPLPDTQLTAATVYKDVLTANAATVQLYAALRTNVLVHGGNTGISYLLGNYADELNNYSSGSNGAKFYLNSLNSEESNVNDLWSNCYSLIYAANAVIEGLHQSTGIAEADKKRLEAEGLFVRAYVHFHLFNLFGPVPYVTGTDYRTNTSVSRMDSATVYARIIADLTTAWANLPDSYSSEDRVRPNKDVAGAVLARVYLYSRNWTAAESQSTATINHSAVYTLESDLDNVFLKSSTSTIWQLKPRLEGMNTTEATTFILRSGPPSETALSEVLLNAFEADDARKTHWLGNVSRGADVWYYPYKYKLSRSSATSEEYSILLRLEEQYLIRAEARLRQGNFSGSAEDINKIRERAGLLPTTAQNEEELLNAVLQERRIEFFSELGHRWFDLKRTGNANHTLSAVKSNWDAKDLLLPLPQNELILNPHLAPQNPGY